MLKIRSRTLANASEKRRANANYQSLTRLARTIFIFWLSVNIHNAHVYFPFWQQYLYNELARAFFYP